MWKKCVQGEGKKKKQDHLCGSISDSPPALSNQSHWLDHVILLWFSLANQWAAVSLPATVQALNWKRKKPLAHSVAGNIRHKYPHLLLRLLLCTCTGHFLPPGFILLSVSTEATQKSLRFDHGITLQVNYRRRCNWGWSRGFQVAISKSQGFLRSTVLAPESSSTKWCKSLIKNAQILCCLDLASLRFCAG